MKKIIDTNVPIIANGGSSDQATAECGLKCVQLIRELIELEQYKLVVDLQWIILREYKRNLESMNGLGNQFLQWVLTNWKSERCDLVRINRENDSFAEFPNDDERLAKFDPADRHWIAVALAHKLDRGDIPPITQAADMKWQHFETTFSEYGVIIGFICDSE